MDASDDRHDRHDMPPRRRKVGVLAFLGPAWPAALVTGACPGHTGRWTEAGVLLLRT